MEEKSEKPALTEENITTTENVGVIKVTPSTGS
jgi:hypothetical protein